MMSDKWDEKMVLQYARELKSPFEQQVRQNGNGRMAGIVEKLKDMANRNKGIKPQ